MSRVVQYHADRTNQKLYFARLSCLHVQQAQTPQQQSKAVEESVFHLYGVYCAFLQEIARHYRLTLVQPTMEHIKMALASQSLVSPEVIQLEQVCQQGFLADIIQAYHLCLYLPDDMLQQQKLAMATQQVQTQGNHSVITVTQVSQNQLPNSTQLQAWYQALFSFIERLREGLLEY